jgi:hypothetical protein
VRFTIDPWDVSYGATVDADVLEQSDAEVALELEKPTGSWTPIHPEPESVPETVAFVDGVRRVDARIWIEHGPLSDAGICATYAAGSVCCDAQAHLVSASVERGTFSASPLASDLTTRLGDYPARMASSGAPESLALALQERMLALELAVAEHVHGLADVDLLVVDGPLRGRQHVPDAIGFIKTHHVVYLPPELNATVAELATGQRTPVFTIGGTWSRHSWYLRLPGPTGSPWAGIVRCESSSDVAPDVTIVLANSASAVLPRFASHEHKDSRAPQNLYPIAGLERELRRRLGDQQLMYRALREAASLT